MAEKHAARLSVHGSRGLKDERVRILILEAIAQYKPSVIVTHAEPGGVCGVARVLCKEIAMPLKLHFLNFKYLRGAFEHRSKDVLRDSDHALFIHDGESKGTSNEIAMAKKMGQPLTCHVLDHTPHDSSVGFAEDLDWSMEGLFDGDDLMFDSLGDVLDD